MPPAKRGRQASNAVVPHTPPRGKINLGTLQMASPKTGERVTSMKRANTPAFCIYSNVRQNETGARIESYYGTLSLYLPEGTADGRESGGLRCLRTLRGGGVRLRGLCSTYPTPLACKCL